MCDVSRSSRANHKRVWQAGDSYARASRALLLWGVDSSIAPLSVRIMPSPIKWVAERSHVRDVSLLETADLAFWKDRLQAVLFSCLFTPLCAGLASAAAAIAAT